MFRPVDTSPRFPALEAEISRFWRERRTYEQSLERRQDAPPFIFYEGPPTANGLPHPGHCLTRAIKDLFPRYRTMRGYRCERKAGWDTHGLPVEVEVCKELGIHSKEEIEAYGIEPFIQKCQQSVWRYMKEWERLTERIGFWIRLDEAYVTYHQSYVESVWWSLKQLFDRGLLYQGHKIVWWWAQGGTALSSGEVGQGYREVADPSVYVRFPLVDEPDTSLLVWTTTPWTLPSNQFAAVHPELEYSVVLDGEFGQKLIVASALVETIAGKVGRELTVESKIMGAKLIGRRYVPPFDYYYRSLGAARGPLGAGGEQHLAWRVVAAEFVTTDSGTGVVHQAPAFGEVDFDVLTRERERFAAGQGPDLICAVGPDGKFTAEAPDYQGRWVKEADKDIARELRRRGLLYHQEQYLHEYPFCWRADEDPLIQYPRRSWFIRTSRFKEQMLANNARINWLPEHIGEGRFGNFLATNVDWALSRERYWGTPLPIWVCEQTGHMEAIASYEELLAKPDVRGIEVWQAAQRANPELPDDLKVHKPYIDAISYASPQAPGKRMRRVSEVIDCWYDSGAMPFAQWGYPHTGRKQFESHFPADFISEAIDQTRGWFYSQLAISTLLFGQASGEGNAAVAGDGSVSARPQPHEPAAVAHEYPHPFRNCIVLGLMLGEDGQKMSKSKRNYREPSEIFDRYGADALRWYLFANQAPWTSIRYNEQAIKDSIPEFLLRLWNIYSFFVIYANIDGFDPGTWLTGDVGELDAAVLAAASGYRPLAERGELDRWILSELNETASAVVERMDAYDNFTACGRITAFVDALSNWYVRRSRDRFWSGEPAAGKVDAYWTLYECLLTTTKLVAPFVPFLAETLWQNLAVDATGGRALESVHLCDYPAGDRAAIDEALSVEMRVVREIVSLGRSARTTARLKVRQPLAKVEVVLVDPRHRDWLDSHAGLIREELNVKQVEFIPRADQYITYSVLPDLKRLGPRLGKRLPALKRALASADASALLAELETQQRVTLDVDGEPVVLDRDDIQVRLQAKPGWAAAHGPLAVVVLSTELSDELVIEGHARELVHAIQVRRKDVGCQYTDRIEVGIVSESAEIAKAVSEFGDYIRAETLARELTLAALDSAEPAEADLAGFRVLLYVRVAKQ
jgi:isoleucyl-tRNA synthetase